MTKAGSALAPMAGRSGRHRNLMLMGVALALAVAAAIGSGASSAGADEACPNEAFRVAQHATQLPDCRAFERVSPADKGDADIIAEGEKIMASEDGDAAAFESRMVFGDAVGSGTVGRTTYLARRGPGGWSTHSVMPMSRPEPVQVLRGSTRVEMMSDDLRNAFVWGYDLPAAPDSTPSLENLYAEDTTTGALRTISKSQIDALTIFDFLNTSFVGYSADAKHIAFTLSKQLLPDAAPGGIENLYKWDDGVLSVAGLLPDGTVPPAGVTVIPDQTKDTMSADGSRLIFNASPDGSAPRQLYLHVDGRKTVWVSEPEPGEKTDPPPATPSIPNGIVFEGMTPDGNNIFFVSDDPLVDADTAPGPDEYRFTYTDDAATNNGNLTLITNNGAAQADFATFGGVLVGMSDDARVAYLLESDSTLRMWQEGVPGLTTLDSSFNRSPNIRISLLASMPGYGRVSPDGNWLAYIKDGEMHLFHRGDSSPRCVSCPSGAMIEPTITDTGQGYFKGFRPTFLSDDGEVFFSSNGALVPGDTNGVADSYEYDGKTGRLSLLSSGKGSEPAMFADASPSGNDVFIATRQQLVKSDRDEYADLYDVRVDGGFDETEPSSVAPCSGEACQGSPAAPPAASAIGSGAASQGNLRRTHCAKHKHEVRRKGKIRCVRKHKRHAKHNRRAGR